MKENYPEKCSKHGQSPLRSNEKNHFLRLRSCLFLSFQHFLLLLFLLFFLFNIIQRKVNPKNALVSNDL